MVKAVAPKHGYELEDGLYVYQYDRETFDVLKDWRAETSYELWARVMFHMMDHKWHTVGSLCDHFGIKDPKVMAEILRGIRRPENGAYLLELLRFSQTKEGKVALKDKSKGKLTTRTKTRGNKYRLGMEAGFLCFDQGIRKLFHEPDYITIIKLPSKEAQVQLVEGRHRNRRLKARLVAVQAELLELKRRIRRRKE